MKKPSRGGHKGHSPSGGRSPDHKLHKSAVKQGASKAMKNVNAVPRTSGKPRKGGKRG